MNYSTQPTYPHVMKKKSKDDEKIVESPRIQSQKSIRSIDSSTNIEKKP